jgi:hypothetical protein
MDTNPLAGLTLDDNPEDFGGIVLDNPFQVEDPEVAAVRAPKYNYAQGVEDDPQVERETYNDILAGFEPKLRERAAEAENIRLEAKRVDFLKELIFDRAGEVTRDEIDIVRTMPMERATPQTVMEKLYASRKANEIAAMPTEWEQPEPDETLPYEPAGTPVPGVTLYDDAVVAAGPTEAERVTKLFETVVGQKEIDQKIAEEYEKEAKGQSWGGFTKDLALDAFIPWWTWFHQANPGDSLWNGTMFTEQRNKLKEIKDLDQYEAALRAQTASLSPTEKVLFMQNMLLYSSSDHYMRQFRTVVDIASTGILAAAPLIRLTSALASGAASLAVRVPGGSRTLDALGRMSEAAQLRALEAFAKRAAASNQSIDEIADAAYSITSPKRVLEGGNAWMSSEKLARFKSYLERNSSTLLRATFDNLPVDRLARGSQALTAAYKEAEKLFATQYNRAGDSIIDVSAIVKDDTLNVDAIQIAVGKNNNTTVKVKGAKKKGQKTQPIQVVMGTNKADLFDDAVTADRWAREEYGLPAGSYTIEPRGAQHFISVIRNVDESADLVRGEIAIETSLKTPEHKWTWLMDMWRNPDTNLSKEFQRESKAIYGMNSTISALRYVTREIPKLTGQGGIVKRNVSKLMLGDREFQRLDDFLRFEQNNFNKITGQRQQVQNLGQFGAEWVQRYGKLPTDREARAYWAWRQVNDIDYAAYNTNLWVAKNRLGWQSFTLPVTGTLMGAPAAGALELEGKFLPDGLPWAQKNADPLAGVLYLDPKDITKSKRHSFRFAKQDELNTLIRQKGLSVVQVTKFSEDALRADPALAAMMKDNPGKISFVLMKDPKPKPLPLRQVPYQPGGHVEYAYGHFVRQPRLHKSSDGVTTYFGDVNLRGGQTAAEAEKFVPRYNQARILLKEEQTLRSQAAKALKGKDQAKATALKKASEAKRDELKKYLAANLPDKYPEWRARFMGKNPSLDIDTPFYASPKGENTAETAVDAYGNKGLANFRDSTGKSIYPGFRQDKDSPFNMYNDNIDLRFGLEKNEPIYRVTQEGDPRSPLFALKPARVIDPTVAMDSTSRYLMRGRYMADYKWKSAEQFVQEFGHLFPNVSKDEMRRNPIKWLMSEIPSGDGADYRAGVAFQRTVKELMHIKSDDERQFMWLRRALLEKAFKVSEDFGIAAEPYLLHKIKDPVHYMRSTAFHLKMLSPPQLFLQASSVVHASSFVGFKAAAEGTMISASMRALRFTDDPAIIAKVAKSVEQFWGMKAAHFTEMYEAMVRSGISKIGYEVGQLNDYFDPAIIQTAVGKTLDAGRWFFNEGERISRNAAWTMAYREWRAANPTAKFSDEAAKKVRYRMDLFTGNMTAQNNAMWQKGWKGVPTQFWSYPIRVSEQFLGGRLTGAERRRMFTTYGLMYGFPNSLNLAMPMWPMSESIRAAALERGFDPDSNTITNILFNGTAGFAVETMAGEQYNIPERFGLGMTVLRDLVYGDKDIFEAFGGASGTAIAEIMGNMMPVFKSFAGMLDPNDDTYPFTWQHVSDLFSTQAFADKSIKAYMAANYHMYFTKKGDPVAPMSTGEGIAGVVFGTIPQDIQDVFILKDNIKHRDKYNAKILREAEKWIRMGLKEDILEEEQEKYFTLARTALEGTDLTQSQRASFMQRVMQDNFVMIEDLYKRTMKDENTDRQQILMDRIQNRGTGE